MSNNFSYEADYGNIFFKYAMGKSIETGREFHTYNEIILFLGGEARLITEKINMELKPDAVIFIPKETYHQMIIKNNNENYLRCVINFEDFEFLLADFPEVKVFYADEKLKTIFEILKKKAQSNTMNEVILKSSIALITDDLANKTSYMTVTEHNRLANSALEYISKNIETPFSSTDVAKYLHVSLSTLQHSFKNEMKISLYEYILKKRLVLARQQLLNGIPATTVALNLGFSDYSGFYKQYKKLFGISPAKTNSKPQK